MGGRGRFGKIGVWLWLLLVVGAVLALPSIASAAGNEVLILGSTVTGGTGSIEAQEVVADGLTPVVVDDATWRGMTTSQFSAYRAIVLGDASCTTLGAAQAAQDTVATWGPAVTGNILINGTDPVFHASQGGADVTTKGIDFVVADATHTGAYVSLSCYYHGTAPSTPVPLLDALRPGGFTVTGVGCYNDAHIVASHPSLDGLTDGTLSGWSCSVHEAFDSWPADFTVLALAKDFGSAFTASDGTIGTPYILARGAGLRSFPLSASPTSADVEVGSTHTITAELLDGATSTPVSGQTIRAASETRSGSVVLLNLLPCSTPLCQSDARGEVAFSYTSNVISTDTILVFHDSNGNESPDRGEEQVRVLVNWVAARSGPVLMIHGIDAAGAAGANCARDWDDTKQFLRSHGYAARDLFTVAYYAGDRFCDRVISGHVNPDLGNSYFDGKGAHKGSAGGHTAEAAIEHLAYHLAWYIYDDYSSNGQRVDVLAHSMGGLIIRYAVAQTEAHNPAFPPKLLVGNVVTFGTPHGGSREGGQALCDLRLRLRECSEMRAGSSFLTGLETNGWNPQGAGGTDWTAMGSDDDTWVAADRAVGTTRNRQRDLFFGGCHKVWYPATRREGRNNHKVKQPIEHSDYFHNGAIAGGMNATNLLAYTSAGHCGAPLEAHTGELHPMGWAALALDSQDY
jgi:hypothetical protein